MKILVAVRRVVDYNVKVRVKSDNSGADIANVKMSLNPFDAIKIITVRRPGFDAAAATGGSAAVAASGKASCLSSEIAKNDRPELTLTKVIVSIDRKGRRRSSPWLGYGLDADCSWS